MEALPSACGKISIQDWRGAKHGLQQKKAERNCQINAGEKRNTRKLFDRLYIVGKIRWKWGFDTSTTAPLSLPPNVIYNVTKLPVKRLANFPLTDCVSLDRD